VVLWRTDLRVSGQAQRLSLLLHALAILALLLAPWSAGFAAVRLALFILVGVECARSLRRIRSREGDIALLADGQMQWRRQNWRLCARPWITKQAILLGLRAVSGEQEKLWLLRDSMAEAEWRGLRQLLLTAE